MTREFATLDGLDVRNRRVLVRVDLNVPMEQGKISDMTRLERQAPTLRELAEKGAKVIALSHFGRPDGKPNSKYSLKPLAEPLAVLIGRPVHFVPDCVGPEAEKAAAALKPGELALLENTRFHAGEEANAPDMAAALSRLGDLYVNDAFSAAHRAHASTEGIAHLLPSYAGRAMQKELDALDSALGHPDKPVLAIVGGAKVSTKIALLSHLIEKVAVLVIGGAMANTFLAAKDYPVGRSLYEPDARDTATRILAAAERSGCRIILPSDVVVAKELAANAPAKTVPVALVPDDGMILDIGSDTIAAISRALERSKTVVWNGPLGAFETPPFDTGTSTVARMVAMLTKARRLTSVAGGGDTVAALHRAAAADDISYVSTAGGAFLEWMEGKVLPGVAALQRPYSTAKINRG